MKAIPILLAHMRDQVMLVKDTTAWTLGRICQLHPQAVTSKLNDLVRVLLESLKDEPRIAAKVCWVRCGLRYGSGTSHLFSQSGNTQSGRGARGCSR